MVKIKLILIAITCLTLANCKTKNDFPIDKKYWDANDYEKVVRELKYGYEPDEKLPSFNDPETRIIVEKLTDHQNFNVILDDNELGLNYKSNFAGVFFDNLNDMNDIYRATDRKDNYIYDMELLKVDQFNLDFYLKTLKINNNQIIENADDPNSEEVKTLINSNIKITINNFINYLNELTLEKSFSKKGKELLAKGIDQYFTILIEQYPDANYDNMGRKIDLMYKKSKSEKIKTSLFKISKLIESKKTKDKEIKQQPL